MTTTNASTASAQYLAARIDLERAEQERDDLLARIASARETLDLALAYLADAGELTDTQIIEHITSPACVAALDAAIGAYGIDPWVTWARDHDAPWIVPVVETHRYAAREDEHPDDDMCATIAVAAAGLAARFQQPDTNGMYRVHIATTVPGTCPIVLTDSDASGAWQRDTSGTLADIIRDAVAAERAERALPLCDVCGDVRCAHH